MIILIHSACSVWPYYPVTEWVGKAFKFKQRMKNLPSCAHVLHKTPNLAISRCCLAEFGEEMYQNLKRTCKAFVFSLDPIVLSRSRCRRRSSILTGLRDSHVRVLALVKVLPSRVYLLENTLFSMKWVVPLVKCSFSAGFCHLWFGGFAWLSLNKAMCLNVAGGVFWSQRSFVGYAFSISDLLLFLFSDCRSYAVSGI